MSTLVLLRHGQSEYNHAGRFTGWSDVPLTARGLAQARQAGTLLKADGFVPQACFSSMLVRAQDTLRAVLEAYPGLAPEIATDWRLNERHYGALQDLDRATALRQFGARAVYRWQRSYGARPPAVGTDDPRHPAQTPGLEPAAWRQFAGAESLADTWQRLEPLWEGAIAGQLRAGHDVLVVSHGNTLRALVAHLEGLPEQSIPRLFVPTARPLRYELDAALRVQQRRYLGQRKWSFKRLWMRLAGVPA